MQSQPHVYLGFSNEFDDDELYRLKSHFLPLGKIGGMPSWLNPRNLPPTSQLLCQVCAKPMCFMLQVYATSEEDPVHSFHRTLFLFICRNPECSRANDASNLAAFRCQLPRQNPFYNAEGPMDPDFGDAENPLKDDTWMKICKVCGAGATKKCGRCGKVWYCDREHQAFDWSKSHKVRCQQENVGEEEKKNPTNEFLFPEYGMEMERENVPATLLADISDSENDDDDDEEIEQERRMRDFQKFVANHKNDEEIAGSELEDAEESQEKDISFARFNRLVSRNPEQVLRYQRGGIPLPATDRAPAPPQPPNCDLCGGKRYFELQLTPHLLSLLGVDTLGHSIDFASIYVFTCASSCPIVDSGYAREFIFKQDFA